MVLAAGDEVALFRSHRPVEWQPCSTFGRGHGAHGGAWETPDLFELPVQGTGEPRWVLVVSVLGGGPAGGTGTQYFVGDFDGATFTPDDPAGSVRWVDHGADFYAPQSWSDAPDGRRIWLAWMSNWAYARTTPAATWRGTMTAAPRRVPPHGRRRGGAGAAACRRARCPARARDGAARRRRPARRPVGGRVGGRAVGGPAARGGVRPAAGRGPDGGREGGRRRGALRPRRLHPGGLPAPRGRAAGGPRGRRDRGAEPGARRRSRSPQADALDLRVVVDTCSVEVFADSGRVVLTNQVFPAPGATGLRVYAAGDEALLRELRLFELSAD